MSTDPSAMTLIEYNRVIAVIDSRLPVAMINPQGRPVIARSATVAARLASGYRLA